MTMKIRAWRRAAKVFVRCGVGAEGRNASASKLVHATRFLRRLINVLYLALALKSETNATIGIQLTRGQTIICL